MIWFSSDQHFAHANVLKHCNRPFSDLHEMHKELTERFNALVKPNDEVYHLGDFCMGRDPRPYLEKLHGRHYLIYGNHDHRKKAEAAGFVWCRDVHLLKAEGETIWLSHYGHRVWPHSHHGSWHLYGHSHGKLPDAGKSCDVGVDCWDYRPVSLKQLKEKWNN